MPDEQIWRILCLVTFFGSQWFTYVCLGGEQNILVVAHRDSLRALFGHLEGVEAGTVFDGTSQTAPLVYEFGAGLRIISKRRFWMENWGFW